MIVCIPKCLGSSKCIGNGNDLTQINQIISTYFLMFIPVLKPSNIYLHPFNHFCCSVPTLNLTHPLSNSISDAVVCCPFPSLYSIANHQCFSPSAPFSIPFPKFQGSKSRVKFPRIQPNHELSSEGYRLHNPNSISREASNTQTTHKQPIHLLHLPMRIGDQRFHKN